MRQFDSGATRDTDLGKFDYEGFFSPRVLEWRAAYMHKHRIQADGQERPSDNWQKGMPLEAYMKSMFRHFMDLWMWHRARQQWESQEIAEDALCAIMFNAEGYLYELIKRHET